MNEIDLNNEDCPQILFWFGIGQISNSYHNNLFSLFVSCLQQQRLKLENVSTIMESTTTAAATTTIQEKKKDPIEEVYKVCFLFIFYFYKHFIIRRYWNKSWENLQKMFENESLKNIKYHFKVNLVGNISWVKYLKNKTFFIKWISPSFKGGNNFYQEW